jgi:hypothetical protein
MRYPALRENFWLEDRATNVAVFDVLCKATKEAAYLAQHAFMTKGKKDGRP